MQQGMSFADLEILLKHIYMQHSPAQVVLHAERRIIKYVHPHVDMRDGIVFAVGFREFFGNDHSIHTQNECSALDKSLFDRCMEYLDESGDARSCF